MLLWALAIIAGAFVAYNLFHYVLFFSPRTRRTPAASAMC